MEVSTKFTAPFGPIPALRLSCVNRWGIIDMKKQQSVAEHCFNVSRIVEYICSNSGYSYNDIVIQMAAALRHDDDEIFSGDIPSPAKNKSTKPVYSIIKLADVIESWIFLHRYCNDTEAVLKWTANKLYSAINEQISNLDVSYEIIHPLMNK